MTEMSFDDLREEIFDFEKYLALNFNLNFNLSMSLKLNMIFSNFQ